ncbi:hypothetical protein GTZ78_50870, partial [Streptomyces sp. SID8361]|nr:hypothetical protein [Streptomyces sp. SID8361]
ARPSAADSRAAGGVTVRIPDAGGRGAGRRAARTLPADSGRDGWITVRVDEEDADDIGLSQLPAAFRAAPHAPPTIFPESESEPEPAPHDHDYAPEDPPTDTRSRFEAENHAAPGPSAARPRGGGAVPGTEGGSAVVGDGFPGTGPVSGGGVSASCVVGDPCPGGAAAGRVEEDSGAEAGGMSGPSAARPKGGGAASGSVVRSADVVVGAEGASAVAGDSLSATGPVGEAGRARRVEGDAASVGDQCLGTGPVDEAGDTARVDGGAEGARPARHGAASAEVAEAGPGEAHRRRPLAAESRPAGRVTVRIDQAQDAA